MAKKKTAPKKTTPKKAAAGGASKAKVGAKTASTRKSRRALSPPKPPQKRIERGENAEANAGKAKTKETASTQKSRRALSPPKPPQTRIERREKAEAKAGTKAKTKDTASTQTPPRALSPQKKTPQTRTKRGEKAEFKEVTHAIISGKYEGFQGAEMSEDAENKTITLRLVKNARGTKMSDQTQIVVLKVSDVAELDSDDMLNFVVDNGDEEDEDLVAHEKGSWECNTCGKENPNDAGYCTEPKVDNNGEFVLDTNGEALICMGTKECEEKKTWADCFAEKVCFSLVCIDSVFTYYKALTVVALRVQG